MATPSLSSTSRPERPSAGPNPGRLLALRMLMAPRRPALASGDLPDAEATDPGTAPLAGHSGRPGAGDLDRPQRALAERLRRGILRHLTLLDALLERAGLIDLRKTPPANLWVLRLAVFEKLFQGNTPDYAIGAESTALARAIGGARAAGFVNAVIRRLLPQLPASYVALTVEPWYEAQPLPVRLSIPQPLKALYEAAYGERATGVLEALAGREATTWLRVNRLRATPAEVAQKLASAGVEVRLPALSVDPQEQLIGRLLPEALPWSGGDGPAPWQSEVWRSGALTVQDLGSMAAAPLLRPQPGMRVLDLCAAPGGKAGHLWELMQGQGELFAAEIEPRRREIMARALKRLYPESPGLHVVDLNGLSAVAVDGFDRVLLDAPCLGLGLIGRHPEVRWDQRQRQFPQVQSTQRDLLARGAALTRLGGHLLWMTCSPTREENEAILEPWLERQAGRWRKLGLAEADPRWAECFCERDGFLRTVPDRQACDAFCLCLLERLS